MPDLRSRRTSLAARTILVTTAVAVVAVLIAGAVALNLVRGAAEAQARTTLGRQADLLASSLERGTGRGGALGPARLANLLRAQRIQVAMVDATGRVRGQAGLVTQTDLDALSAGRTVSRVESSGPLGRAFVEGRAADGGGGVVLRQPTNVVGPDLADARKRIALALLAGLAAAVLAGVVLARRLARPLQRAAAAAHQLSLGQRDVRLAPEGPAEVAEVAEALNRLGAALATSEGRQRDFLLSVSHELRTPLTAVKGYAEALADGVVEPAAVSATGATMLAEAGRLDRLVSDLLDLARLGAQDFRVDLAPVDLTDLVRRAGEVWTSRAEPEGVQLRVELPPGPLVVRTDATRARQIVDGLAENALRVTPSGRPVVLAVLPAVGGAVLEVRDGGPGLTPDDLAVAFERSVLFERYRGIRKVGTGFGLALVAGLASRLGGHASAGVAPEGGARFTVWLPADPAGHPADTTVLPVAAAPGAD
jgi:two-component system OmpR family sensor kinase